LSLPLVARRLEDRLHLLRWDAPDVPERQRSLEAAVGWSYDLLSDDERRLFRHLGVFAGRVALEALAAVVGDAGGTGDHANTADQGCILEGMASLAQKSLVLPGHLGVDDDDEGVMDVEDRKPAFGMLETVREYARELLARHGDLQAAQRAHARY